MTVMNDKNMLVEMLRDVQQASSLTMHQWDLLLRQARESGLLSRLSYQFQQNHYEHVPEQLMWHFESAITYAERQRQVVEWEVRCISEAMASLDVPIVLLKGAAYVMAVLPSARGRIFSDIDLLVPKQQINAVEKSLFGAGWVTTHLNAYDQRYYRQWMHEIPPMQHHQRRSVLDVHHNILPVTARANPDASLLLSEIKRIDENKNLYVLSPCDMIIHSATHLFFDGEFEHGLRDLLDMHDLITYFAGEVGFWQQLVERAEALTLLRPLYYALMHVQRLYHTEIPANVFIMLGKGKPRALTGLFMNRMFELALRPPHSSCRNIATASADAFLYTRAHFLRMPLHLLIPHLTRKAFRPDD